jgi:phosphotransferase system  glucose/maltose/N-acetylglucosamine-specific IIC component
MRLANLFYSTYWFKQPVVATKSAYFIWLIGLLAVFAVGLGALIASSAAKSNLNKTILRKFGDLFSNMGIAGLLLFFCRQQSIPLFGLRIWFLVWGIVFAIWLGFVLKYLFKRVPAIKLEQEEKARKEKYLPAKN